MYICKVINNEKTENMTTYKIISKKNQGIYSNNEIIRILTTINILNHYSFFEFSKIGYDSQFNLVEIIEIEKIF